jgi:hypothetical protein
LLKGAMRAWLRPAPGRPRNVRIAIRLMCAGVAAQPAVLITVAVTAGSVRAAVARGYPGLAAAQHAVNASLVIDYVGASIGIVVWLALAWALVRGHARARTAMAGFPGSMTLSMLRSLRPAGRRHAQPTSAAGPPSRRAAVSVSAIGQGSAVCAGGAAGYPAGHSFPPGVRS